MKGFSNPEILAKAQATRKLRKEARFQAAAVHKKMKEASAATRASNVAKKQAYEGLPVTMNSPVSPIAEERDERIGIDPVGMMCAISKWFDLGYKGFAPDIPDEMLNIQNNILWFARWNSKNNTVMLHRKDGKDVRVYELDKAWFDALAQMPLQERYWDPQLQVYVPIE